MTRFILIASLLSIFGCENSDLESAIYSREKGVMLCLQCLGERKKEDWEKMKENYRAAAPLDFVKQKMLSEISAEYYQSSLYGSNVDITKISSSSTSIKDVWDVKIVGHCKTHGKIVRKAQYSFRDGKARWIKNLDQ